MNSNIDTLSDLFHLGNSEDRSTTKSTQVDTRTQELNEIVKFREEFAVQHKKKSAAASKNFAIMSGIFGISAILMLLGKFFNSDITDFGVVGAIFSGIWGGIFAYKQLSYIPLQTLKERIERANLRLSNKLSPQQQSKALKVVRQKKVFMGVGAFLAEKTDIAPEVVRSAMVVLAFLSMGVFLPAYIILGFVFSSIRKSEDTNY